MLAGKQTEHRDHDVAHNVDRLRQIEPFGWVLALTPPLKSHFPNESEETQNKIAGIDDDAAEYAHLHHLLPYPNYVIGKVTHHME